MTTARPQRIRDPIHDLIGFDTSAFEQACWRVLQTRPFQRLRRIKQLGFSDFTYPGATHSRFAHSLGVFHTARQLAAVLKSKFPGSEWSDHKSRVAIAAALLHDVGHGPFSHSFEDALMRLEIEKHHEAWTSEIIRSDEVRRIYNKEANSFADEVADLINPPEMNGLAVTPVKDIYSSIVSSQFDADRLDYMRRDKMMSGTQHSAIDFSWLIANLEVGSVPIGNDEVQSGEVQTFVLNSKAIHAAESYVLSLFHLYPTVYLHKATRGMEKLFSELVFQVGTCCKSSDFKSLGLQEQHPLVQFFLNPDCLERYLALDDTVIWGALPLLASGGHPVASDVAKRLLWRKLYKSIDVGTRIRLAGKTSQDELLKHPDIMSLLQASTSAPELMYDVTKRNPYKRSGHESGGINQIWAYDKDKEIKDLNEISPVVKALQPYSGLLFYYRDGKALLKLEDILKGMGL